MKLHIFNPEHDMALASNADSFTPPKAARLTRAAFCHRPALWADDGDWVLVDDIDVARRNLLGEEGGYARVRFVTTADLAALRRDDMPDEILPWGWDRPLAAQLLRCNPLFRTLLPTDGQLDEIRMLSSRCFVAETLLPVLVAHGDYVGEMTVCRSEDAIMTELNARGGIVVKSPWSCSGRGVRFLRGGITPGEQGWIRNTLNAQGAVTAEPIYNKVIDFALEFHAGDSAVEYRGVNIFETRNGAYQRNIPGSQQQKLDMLAGHVGPDRIAGLKERLLAAAATHLAHRYTGPFGVDMMIVLTADGEKKIHPCVELNLRRTMGNFQRE